MLTRRSAHVLRGIEATIGSVWERGGCEPLEPRVLLSTIVWANRNDPANNFASTWGVNTAAAMAVVDEVINQYERVIVDFDYSGGTTQYDLNVSMRDQPTNPFGGQTPPNQVTVNGSGAPSAANVFIGAGLDTSGDGVGDGGGYFVDPTPDDFSEFTTVVNAFVGDATGASPAFNLRDFYSICAHEIGHAIGMTSASGSDWDSFILSLANDSGVGDSSGNGNLWAIQTAALGRAVLTDTDLGAASGQPVHTAVAGQSFMFNGQLYTSAAELMNNTFQSINGRRRLISNLQIGLMGAVSTYDWVWPEVFGSMYSSLDTTTGQLTIRGGAGGSNDIIRVTWDSGTSRYLVSVNIGNDIPGTGPTDAFESTWTDGQISSIVINGGDGDDTIEVRTLSANEPVTVNAGTGDDDITIAIGDFNTNLLSDVTVNGDAGSDSIWVNDLTDGAGDDVYTITNTTFAKPGRTLTFAGIQRLDIDGSDNNDVYNIESFNGDSLIVDGQDGNDVFNIAQPSGDMDALSATSTLLGGLGDDTLNLFDQNDTLNDSYLFDDDIGPDFLNFTKTGGGFGGMLQSSMNNLLLEANGASNLITIEEFFPTSATINANGGNDTFDVGNGDIDLFLASNLLVLNGGTGTDQLILDDTADAGNDTHLFDRQGTLGAYIKVGDNAQVQFTSLDGVTLNTSSATNLIQVDGLPAGADLLINGNLGQDTALIGGGDIDTNLQADVDFEGFINGKVIFNDTTDGPGVDVYTLDGGTLTKGARTITFGNVNEVTLDASPNSDTINLDGSFGYALTVQGNNGDDNIIFGDGSLAFMDDATIFGGGGADTLRFDDTNAFAATTWEIDQTGGLPFVDLFNGSTRVLYDSISDLIADAGPMDDTITSIAVPSETALRINGNGGADTIAVQGHPTQNSALFPRVTIHGGAGADIVQVNTDGTGGARAIFEQSQDLATLQIGDAGRLRLAPGNLLVEVQSSVSLPSSGFELDLTDGNFVRRGSTNYAFYDTRVISGYAAGAWTGLGITSSTAAGSALGDGLGLAVAGDLFNGGAGAVGGIALQPNDLIIRYTIYGDADLNRQVDITDLGLLATNWQLGSRRWNHGDFDFSHLVDITDLGRLATNWQVVLPLGPQPDLAAAPGRRGALSRTIVIDGMEVAHPDDLLAAIAARERQTASSLIA